MKPLVSVVIPFYNEEASIRPLAERIEAVFTELPNYEHECLFVNDGSTDDTRAVIDALSAENPCVRPIHLVENRGQSAAILAGFQRAKGDYLLMLDGDGQNDPCDFPAMLELLKEYDCVCGYRAERQDTWLRRISSKLANRVRNAILKDGIRDSGCGSKGFRRECVAHMVAFNGLHRFFAALMRNAGFTIAECPVTHHPRVHGVSKYGVHNRLWRGIYDLVGVRWLCKRYVAFRVEGEE